MFVSFMKNSKLYYYTDSMLLTLAEVTP